jgi:hypothetical protein
MTRRNVTPIIANSTTIDNQVVFATVFIGTLHACGRIMHGLAREWEIFPDSS